MRVTLRQVKVAEYGMGVLAASRQPPKAAYRIAKLLGKVEDELRQIERYRVEWINELGTGGAESESKEIRPGTEAFEEFERRWEEMMDIEIDIPGIEPIRIETLGDAQIDARALFSLGPFVTDEAGAA